MAQDITSDAIEWVSGLFAPELLAPAIAIARAGGVHLVRGDWPVVAQVRDQGGHVVTVYYRPEIHHARSECTCAAGADCVHATAAALVAIDSLDDTARQRFTAQKQAAVGEWLVRLGRVAQHSEPEPRAEHAVAFVLIVRDDDIAVELHKTRRLRRGGWGASSRMAFGRYDYGTPHWVDDADRRMLALLQAAARVDNLGAGVPVRDITAELWGELAATERLFWGAIGTVPLAYGPPRTAQLIWTESLDAPGEYRAEVDEPVVAVASSPCHYVDRMRAVIGPLDLGLPAAIVPRLLTGPPVPAAMRETVARTLAPLVPANASAPPLIAEHMPVDADLAPLRPALHVSLEPDDEDEHRVCLRADAVYGDRRFELAVWEPNRLGARDLARESQLRDRLDDLVDHGYVDMVLGAEEELALLRHVAQTVAPTLADEGWDVTLEDDLPVDAAAIPTAWYERIAPLKDDDDWFGVGVDVVVDGREVPLLPILLQAIRSGDIPLDTWALERQDIPGQHVRLDGGELLYVTGARLRRWLRLLLEIEQRGLDDDGTVALPDYRVADLASEPAGPFSDSDVLASVRSRISALVDLSPRVEAASFDGTLRAYQRTGLAWLRALHDAGYGGILADDMGLGKTAQVLAFVDELRAEGTVSQQRPALVVAPRSVVGHWRDEAQRFAPQLSARVHLGPKRPKRADAIADAMMIVTSYQTLARDIDVLEHIEWATVVFDEAQAVKNPTTTVRKAAARLRAASRFCMTGTPVENHLGELWSQIDLAMPGLLGRKRTFDSRVRRPVEKHGSLQLLELLRQRIRPFLLRRRKSEVELDLPAKSIIVEPVELDPAQRDLYEGLRLSLDKDVRKAMSRRGAQGAQLVILDALLKLRQACCHPQLINTPQAQALTASAKLDRLMAMLDELVDTERSVLVFSQFTSMLRIIATACTDAGIAYLELTGATTDRDSVVRRFQRGDAPVFLISLKAGGTGLNLTRADTVIHFDPWWNPAVEDQATDRAHRIGQTKRVMVYKLVARGTLEETMVALQDRKRALIDAALRDGGITHLQRDDLAALYHQLV